MEVVVAGGADRQVEGVEVAAHRVGVADPNHVIRNIEAARDARLECDRLDAGLAREAVEAALHGAVHGVAAGADRDERVDSPRLEPELALGVGARKQLGRVEQHDRRDDERVVAARRREAGVVGGRQLAGLEHEIEAAFGREELASRARLATSPAGTRPRAARGARAEPRAARHRGGRRRRPGPPARALRSAHPAACAGGDASSTPSPRPGVRYDDRYSTRMPSLRTTGAAADSVKITGSSPPSSRLPVAMLRVRCPNPVPLLVT